MAAATPPTASLFVPGHVGDYYFQVQGNTLFSDQVMYEAALAFTRAKGTLADHVMRRWKPPTPRGGDKRCNCETDPKPSAPCDGKTAHVAYIVIARKDEATTKSHNQGDYYAYIRVTDDDIKASENANPVKTLRIALRRVEEGGIEAVQNRADRNAEQRRAGSLVRDLFNHRFRSGNQRVWRGGPVSRVHRRRRGALCHPRHRRGRDAGVGEPAVRSEGDRSCSNKG